MESIQQSRLASMLTALAGVWILISPLFISITGAALVNILVVGAVITLAGLIELAWVNELPSWINIIAAIWLFVSAFAFSVSAAVAWNETISAIVVFLLSVWDGAEATQVRREQHTSV